MKIKAKLLAVLVILILLAYLGLRDDKLNSYKPTLIVKYINQWPGFKLESLEMLYEVLSEDYNIVSDQKTSDYDLIIDGVFGNKKIENKDAIKIFFTGEAFEPDIGKYDLSIGYSYIDSQKYIRIPLAYMEKGRNGKLITSNLVHQGKCNPKKEYFACFLVGNGTNISWLTKKPYDGVIARDLLFHRLSLYKKVESGGKHLNNRGEPVPMNKTNEFLSNCKFIIAFENQTFPGYITEKPFQAYMAGSVPIYYADKQAVQDINKNSIIFAPDFDSQEALVEYIIKVDNDDALYCKIWNEKLIVDPQKNYEAIKNNLRQKLKEVILKQ